jgi:serine/threonine protein kinase
MTDRPPDESTEATADDEGLDFDAMLLRAKLRSKMFGVDSAPARIGRFRVLGVVAGGAMSVVYKAHDEEHGRTVAVKLLNDKGGDDTPHGQRMLREAKALGYLVHPNVVELYEAGTFGERMYLAMELVEGTTLLRWQEAEPRPWRDVLEKYRQAGRGLQAAHEAGMVHRDFKPANALLGSDGRVRVVDFGLARATGGAEPAASAPGLDVEVTNTGELIGTPAYMSPEQAKGERVDGRSDQFSFCVALYEALYGERPPGVPPEAPPRRGIPARVHAALRRGLSKAVEQRFASMRALLAELEPAAHGRRIAIVAAAVLAAIVLLGLVLR